MDERERGTDGNGLGSGGAPPGPGAQPSGDHAADGAADRARRVERAERERAAAGAVLSDRSYLGPDVRPETSTERELGDFTTRPSVLRLVPLAVVIGALGAGISLGLLMTIGFLTNLLYYHRVSVHLVSPNANTLGAVSIVIPIVGGLVVGLMARYGSEQIRGHGIPEAMENILINGSKVQPRLAVLKPVSSAISIGTGGPFGAEGPIILTGGAVGSIIGQLFRLTAAERRGLLVAGAAAGMSAVFGTPVAATLFGVELLVFEFKPRSMVLIGIAAATADLLRVPMAGAGLVLPQPLFPVPHHAALTGAAVLGGAAVIGISGGLIAWFLTQAVYKAEDAFGRLRAYLHWMWWPLFGGLIVGVGGLVDPRALGVGYNTIHAELLGQLTIGALVLLFFVKLVIWAGALGSGTSGGILAPILIMGAALGGVLGHVLPGGSPAIWALIGMSAALGGVTRSPFTAIVFAFELTHDQGSLLALLIAATLSHLVSVLVLKRSILTEKVARRGFHVMREYSVDPLEAVFVREVMSSEVFTVDDDRDLAQLYTSLGEGSLERRQRLYPVLDGERFVGVLPWSAILEHRSEGGRVSAAMFPPRQVAYPDETLRAVAGRMAVTGIGVIPVVERGDPERLVGLLTQFELLRARQRLLEDERRAERVLLLRRVATPERGTVVVAGPPAPQALAEHEGLPAEGEGPPAEPEGPPAEPGATARTEGPPAEPAAPAPPGAGYGRSGRE